MTNYMIFLLIIIVLIMSFIWLVLNKVVKPIVDRKLDIEDRNIKNKKYELFMNLSPEAMNESLDNYFEQYINRYITYKFISKKIIYIKQEDIETMIRDITKLICIEISELYIFYINMTVSITDDESLTKYIHSKVMTMSVEAVTNYNKMSID